MNPTSPWNYWMQLNDEEPAVDGSADIWNDTAPSASIFTIGDHVTINTDTDNFIAYCFHSVEGYSKIGSWVDAGDVDGTFIYCGFRPAWLLCKTTNASGQRWHMYDDKRDPYNVEVHKLDASSGDAESVAAADDGGIDFVSNGFKIRGTDFSTNMLFMAFAQSPFKYSNAR
tara:strand:- start:171 stop:683 length:513 start_codon:yes stop_codon:yes gene_type:complete